MDVQLGQRAVEVELGAETEAMDGAAPVLTQIDLVHVGVQEIFLAEAGLQDDRHGELSQLSAEGAPIVEKIALHQLLGQRAASLPHLAGGDVHPERPGDAAQVEAGVAVEVAVLHGFEGFAQQIGYPLGRQHQPVLAVGRKEAADGDRVQPDQRHRTAKGVLNRR